MKKYVLYSLFVFALLFTFISSAGASDILIIANKGVSASSISGDELKRIYLGKMTRWEDGDKVNFCLIKTDLLKKFTKDYLGLTATKYLKHWKKMVFTGKGSMPPFYTKDEEVVDFVANTKGAIGFVPDGSNTDSVKVLSVE